MSCLEWSGSLRNSSGLSKNRAQKTQKLEKVSGRLESTARKAVEVAKVLSARVGASPLAVLPRVFGRKWRKFHENG